MSEPFKLTMCEAPDSGRPYQTSTDDGATWRGITAGELRRITDGCTTYPDATRERIDSGDTVRVLNPGFGWRYLRRRPGAADQDTERRQMPLL